ncbi:MAG: bifunctional methylenetetrahydrofolate dehydrogenase/methenyltetrahydrofolate cyclohydrolase FolD [Stellaceae bacterium]
MADARIIDGKAIATGLRRRVADAATQLRERFNLIPGLATILVGDDPASRSYVRAKTNACAAAGLASFERRLPGDAREAVLVAEIAALAADDRVDGILVQLPLPGQIDVHRVIAAVDPEKDVDGFHPIDVGRLWTGCPGLVPCTPQGILMLLRAVHPDLAGAEAVVLGRSNIVGKPMAALLLAADCTVTMVHSKTCDAASVARRADILIAATGRPLMVTPDWVKPGATVIDAGISPVQGPDGVNRLVGDVDFAAVRDVAGAITPVPGGVGPMTIACLLRNTLLAACRRRGLGDPRV